MSRETSRETRREGGKEMSAKTRVRDERVRQTDSQYKTKMMMMIRGERRRWWRCKNKIHRETTSETNFCTNTRRRSSSREDTTRNEIKSFSFPLLLRLFRVLFTVILRRDREKCFPKTDKKQNISLLPLIICMCKRPSYSTSLSLPAKRWLRVWS